MLAALSLMLMVLIANSADARTWHVERDGSGDFTTIRPAIEASAPGDTVLLGPGRYTEVAPLVTPGWTEPTYVPITVDSLTLRGVDRETVIIGPTTPDFQGFGPKGIVTTVGITRLVIENLSVENLRDGFYLIGRSDVRNCNIIDCDLGINIFGVGSTVTDCTLLNNDKGIITFTGCSDLTIENCTFVDNNLGVGVNRTQNVTIRSCVFSASAPASGAIQYSEDSAGLIQECRISDVGDGIAIRSESDVTLQGNTMDALYVGLYVVDGSIARGSNNVFRGGNASIAIQTTSTAFLSGNHILKTGEWAVHCDGFNLHEVDIDLRNNYWGTDSADSISAWIFDGNDPQEPFYVENMSNVLYEPFSPVPVETEESSLGSLKSRFRAP